MMVMFNVMRRTVDQWVALLNCAGLGAIKFNLYYRYISLTKSIHIPKDFQIAFV